MKETLRLALVGEQQKKKRLLVYLVEGHFGGLFLFRKKKSASLPT